MSRPGRATDKPVPEKRGGAAADERQPLGGSAARLAEVSRELAESVAVLRRLAEAETLRDLALGQCSELTGAAVRSIIAARKLRDQYFWPEMAEAAWSLLLELFAARLEGRRLDAAALGKAAGLPAATVAHWIDWLAGRRMIRLTSEGGAEGEPRVDLSEAGADEMRAYLLGSLRLSPWVQ